MTKTQIEKLLKLLKDNKLQDLRNELIKELLKSEDKSKASLFNAVKNYLKQAGKTKPILQTVQHKNGKQFIIDGFSAFVFEKWHEELEMLPTTTEQESLNIFSMINYCSHFEKIDFNDLILLKNIKKYISWQKSINSENKDALYPIFWNNGFYNAKLLEKVFNIIPINETLELSKQQNMTQLKNNDIIATVLPLMKTQLNTYKIMEETNKFLDLIKE